MLQNESHGLQRGSAHEYWIWKSEPHRLSYTLLTVLHEQIGDLLNNRIIPALDVTIFRQRQCWHLKFEARLLW
jgi:hypothetical protein